MLIKNGFLIDPASGISKKVDLRIADGKILSMLMPNLSLLKRMKL